jgi:hypothetical protein
MAVAAGATEVVRFVLADQAVVLSSVNVRERETCRVNADTGFMVARVWEEARKAMLTTQLSAAVGPRATRPYVTQPDDARISQPAGGAAGFDRLRRGGQ